MKTKPNDFCDERQRHYIFSNSNNADDVRNAFIAMIRYGDDLSGYQRFYGKDEALLDEIVNYCLELKRQVDNGEEIDGRF